MANVNGKAYSMNVITPMKPCMTWINRLIFNFAKLRPGTLAGLKGLQFIHFACWFFIKRDQWPYFEGSGQEKEELNCDYMMFCSNFNGTWDQYIDAFSDGIPNGLNLFWYSSIKFPQSIPITAFKNYITFNQVDTDYYFNATPTSAQRDVKAALRVNGDLQALAQRSAGMTPDQFAEAYRQLLLARQNDLGSHGEAPVAGLSTEKAKKLREARQKELAAERGVA